MKNKKAQIDALSLVLVFIIVLIIITLTYRWGTALNEKQKERTTANQMIYKFYEIRNNVVEVVQGGTNASRMVQLNIPVGKFSIKECTSASLSAGTGPRTVNGFEYTIDSNEHLVDSDAWVVIDDISQNATDQQNTSYGAPGVLIANSTGSSGFYKNNYRLVFRSMKTPDNRVFVYKINASDISSVSGGAYTMFIENIGTYTVNAINITAVKVTLR